MNKRFMLGFLSLSMLSFSSPSYAASDAECAIWLCLPAGFPAGCSDAKNAFNKRIRKGKSPLPAFASCAVSDPQNSAFEGVQPRVVESFGSYIPAHKICTKSVGHTCLTFKNVPERFLLKACPVYHTANILGGVLSDKTCMDRRTITLMQGEQILGETFYY